MAAGGIRIAKYLAQLGLGSRRAMEEEISRGAVKVNNQVLGTPAFFVTPEDQIMLRDQEVSHTLLRPRLFRYAKPTGLLVSHQDPQGRRTVFQALPPHLPRLISVGRLDLNSEGLLLLTTSGPLARVLEHPSTGLKRLYRVRVWGKVQEDMLEALARGITVEGVTYGPIEARLEAQQTNNAWVEMALREGKNREIRKVMGAFGLQVNRLIRLSYGPFHLKGLGRGEIQEIPLGEFKAFLEEARP